MKRAALLVLPLLFVLTATAPAEEIAPVKVDTKAAEAMARSNNAFALDLYGALRKGAGNLLFSPYSIQSALMMAREGAAGETARQMDRALHLRGLRRGEGYRALRDSLRPSTYVDGFGRRARRVPSYRLNIANAIWAQKRYFVKSEFLDPLREVYRAPLLRADFQRPREASRLINRWVARETRNKIRAIVDPASIPRLTRLAIANAVHFKASWNKKFSKSATKHEVFFGPGGKNKAVPLMWQVEHFGYAEAPGVQMLSLPYILAETSMVVFLPRARQGLASVEEKLCAGAYGAWGDALEKGHRRVDVKLPRFEFEASFELSRVLADMGMPDAFQLDKADFSRVSDLEDVFLAAVLHKGWIRVDEEGTEAVAATVPLAAAGEALPSKPVVFRADHPFLFLIRHEGTGAILFMGRVTDPK